MSMKDDSPEYEWLWRLQKHIVRNRNYCIMRKRSSDAEHSLKKHTEQGGNYGICN